MNRLFIRCAVIIVCVAGGFISLHWRTNSVVNSSGELVEHSKELLSLLRSVRDPASADAATSKLAESYDAVSQGVRSTVNSAKSADRRGGVTEEGLKKVKADMASFQSLMGNIRTELDRIEKMRNLPPEF